MDVKLSFDVKSIPTYSVSHREGRKTLEIQAFDGIITVSVQYTFNRRALSLESEIKLGDHVEVVLQSHRIELYVNGHLCDEEWPVGERLFDANDEFLLCSDLTVEEYAEESKEMPDTLYEFENAEGWYPKGGVFVGDCMPYRRKDEYHVLYLKDRHHHRSKWGLGAHQWEHISTKDFKKWCVHPMAVPITDAAEGSICTGSWIADDNCEYLYYTVRRANGEPAPIRRSVSRDGYHFEKDNRFGFTVSDKYHAASARDPKVIMGDDGLFHMLLTTSLTENNRGCLAHYISKDLENWDECEEPLYVSDSADQPECPDYFKYSGRYYLIFSIRGRARYMISDRPFDGFVAPKDPVIPCGGVPKCAPFGDRLVFTGFKHMGGYGGSLTFKAARVDESGELVFEDM